MHKTSKHKDPNDETRPLVTVVIPFFERSDWLTEALDSVFAQSRQDFEIVLVDDGSKEDITLITQQYDSRLRYVRITNQGPAAARNLGIKMASGTYIAFLDSDDLWEPEKLAIQIRFMEESGAIWSHSSYYLFDSDNLSDVRSISLRKQNGYLFPRSLTSMHIATPSVMILADFLRNNESFRFNERMRNGQDYYLWLILSMELPLSVIDKGLVWVRNHGQNASKRARIHLRVRAGIWMYLLRDRPTLLSRVPYGALVRWLFFRCYLSDSLVSFLEQRFDLFRTSTELLSKVLYLNPYLVFRIMYTYYSRRDLRNRLSPQGIFLSQTPTGQ